jgi:hypothetical protein
VRKPRETSCGDVQTVCIVERDAGQIYREYAILLLLWAVATAKVYVDTTALSRVSRGMASGKLIVTGYAEIVVSVEVVPRRSGSREPWPRGVVVQRSAELSLKGSTVSITTPSNGR